MVAAFGARSLAPRASRSSEHARRRPGRRQPRRSAPAVAAPRHPVELVAWSNEEGGRFPPCTMGSAVYTGARALGDFLAVKDNEGIALKDALAQTPAATPP